MALIDQEQATQIANAYLKSLGDYSASGGLMLQEQFTSEKPYGWIFFYNTRAYIETGNFLHAIGGVAPFLVERDGGGIYSFGTSQPLDNAIAEYERTHPFPAASASSGDQQAPGAAPGAPVSPVTPADQPASQPELYPSAPAQPAGTPQPFAPAPSQPLGAMGPYMPPPSQPYAGAMPQPDVAPGNYPGTPYPPGAYPYGAYPTGAYPPGMYAPGNYPPSGAYPPGNYPTGGYPPGAFPPGAYPTGNYPTGGYPTGAFAPPMGSPSPQPATSPARWIIPVAIGAALIIILVTFLVGTNLVTQAQHANATATSIAQTTGTANAEATNIANQETQIVTSENATGTALAVAARQPYHAAVPGSCDKGGATWEALGDTTMNCTSSELALNTSSTVYEGEVDLSSYSGTFALASDAKVEVTVRTPTTCAGIALREPASTSGGYSFLVCPHDGIWDLIRYSTTGGTPTDLNNGSIAAQATYHIQAIAKGSALTFIADGHILTSVTDKTYTTNDNVGLIEGATGEPGPAYFSNFTFTPLSQG